MPEDELTIDFMLLPVVMGPETGGGSLIPASGPEISGIRER